MYIRQIKKKRSHKAKTFFQYSLVQNTRIGQKVKQTNILYIGSQELLADKHNRKLVQDALTAKIYQRNDLFPVNLPDELDALVESLYAKYQVKYPESLQLETPATVKMPPRPEKADYQLVDINACAVSEVKGFGGENLCKQACEQLKLEEHLMTCGLTQKESKDALISIIARAVYSSSEWKTSQILRDNSSLCDLFNREVPLTHKQLYTISDKLYEQQEKLDKLLYKQITDLFNLQDRIVIFDLSNSYFETSKQGSELAQFGRSKEKRNDCPLVVFSALINAQGFIRSANIYEGNQPDAACVEDVIKNLEAQYQVIKPSAKKPTVVIDAGIATDENLTYIKEKGYTYVCVARQQLKDYQLDLSSLQSIQTNNQETVQLQVLKPEKYEDTWLYVQSEAKQRKELSIDKKLCERFEVELANIAQALTKKGGTKSIHKVWERIGRSKERYKRVAYTYQIDVTQEKGKATAMSWNRKELGKQKEDKRQGVYFIRTNLDTHQASDLWKIYNTIREVESTFRCLKTDLNIRPIHHQKDERIKAHIYLTVLAYQVVNTIRYQTKQAGIHYDWKNITRIASTQTIQNIELPTEQKTIYLNKVSRPITELKQIYDACQFKQDMKAKRKYVVYH